jgi:hypothetical protein
VSSESCKDAKNAVNLMIMKTVAETYFQLIINTFVKLDATLHITIGVDFQLVQLLELLLELLYF